MTVLGDLVGRERRSERVALRVADRDRDHSYRNFCTTAWKAGHALRHLGVHEGSRVALVPEPTPQIVQTCFGAALLGARVTFDPHADARVVVGPVDREADLDGERRVVVYGGAPEASTTTHWERVVWSENPAVPPGERSPDEVVLEDGSRSFTHCDLLTRADRVDIDAETSVALRASLADPRAMIAGVLAPLSVDGSVVLPGGVATAVADVAVSDDAVPEPRRIALDTVSVTRSGERRGP
ncbi:MAG: AMP-binding protein [Haloplanus sp.]